MKYKLQIGITLLGALLIVYLGTFFLKRSYNVFTGNVFYYKIFFKDVNGLKKEDPVKVFGYEVGEVKEIILSDSGAIVRVEVYQPLVLHSDVTAEIQIKEILTGKQVVIYPGTSPKKFSQEQIIRGISNHDFSKLTSKFGKIAEAIPEQSVVNVFERIDTLTQALVKLTRILNKDNTEKTIDLLNENLKMLLQIEKDIYKYQTFGTLKKLGNFTDSLQNFLLLTRSTLQKTNLLLDTLSNHSDKMVFTLKTLPLTLQKTNVLLTDLHSLIREDETLLAKLTKDKKLVKDLERLLQKTEKTLDLINNDELKIGLKFSRKKKKK